MKVRILDEFNINLIGAEIVEAKVFDDFTVREARKETGDISRWKGDEIFAKRNVPNRWGEHYLYMRTKEIEVIEE